MKEAWAVTSVNLGGHFHGNVLEMVLNAGPMVQFVLLLLLSFSIISWAIILMKYRVVRKSKKENRLFMDAYMKSGNFSDVFIESKKFRYSTIAEVFRAGYTELGKLAKSRTNPSQESETIDDGKLSFGIGGVDNIERALNRASDSETSKIESFLGFLATAGNSSPFIGLFGTVWGIMNAFRGIGTKASATLAVVAPGISEALIATAAGLAVAIPAVIFYNYYLNQVKEIKLETDDFALEFLNIVERYYIKK